MKALHGVSPISVAALLVAVVVLPVVFFPFGAAVVANVVFVYGYKEYARKRSVSIFRLALATSLFYTILLILLFIVFRFDWIYAILRFVSLFGFIVRGDLPEGSKYFAFMVNTFFALAGINVYIFYTCYKHVKYIYAPKDAPHLSRGLLLFAHHALPVILIMLLILHTNYFGNYGLGERNYDARLINDQNFRDVFFIGITYALSAYSLSRTSLRNIMNRRGEG